MAPRRFVWNATFRIRGALCRFVSNATRSSDNRCGGERVSRQVLQAWQALIRGGDEVLGGTVSACGALGLLKLPVHRFDEGVAAVVEHAARHRIEAALDRGGQLLERLKPTASGPARRRSQGLSGRLGVVVLSGVLMYITQRQAHEAGLARRGAARLRWERQARRRYVRRRAQGQTVGRTQEAEQ